MTTTLRRIRGPLLAAGLTLAALWALAAWPEPIGRVSHANFGRIQIGTDRHQVASLLGSPGVTPISIPTRQPWQQVPGSPPGWTAVVWGDGVAHWTDGYRDIYVGFAAGRVTSASYWEPSL